VLNNEQEAVYGVLLSCALYFATEALQLLLSRTAVSSRQLISDGGPSGTMHLTQREANEDAFVIVAAHKAYDSLRTTLPTVLAAFPAHRVYVADNGLQQDTDTERMCMELGVMYRYYDIPNKTHALYQTALHISQTYRDSARAVVLLDDDTKLPDRFFVRQDLLHQPLVAGYCVGITVDKQPPYNLWEQMVDFEYRTISYRNAWKAERGTIHFLHGICAVYNLRQMITIYSKVCTLPHGLPFGEDSFAGIDSRMAGYRLMQDNINVVTTFCPRRLFPPLWSSGDDREQGYGAASLWKQRAWRWYLSWPRRLPGELALGLTYDAGNWLGNVLYRLDLLWYLLIIFVSSAWPFYLVQIGVHHRSWALFGLLHGGLFLTSTATAAIRYLGFPDQLKKGVNKSTFLLIPFMNLTVCFLMCVSFFLSILWYIPFKRVDYKRCYAQAL